MPKKKTAAKKRSVAKKESPAGNIPPELLELLYKLAINRVERNKFLDKPDKYIDEYNRQAARKISSTDRQILIDDVKELKRIVKHRRTHVPFVSKLAQAYGTNFPVLLDAGGDKEMEDDNKHR